MFLREQSIVGCFPEFIFYFSMVHMCLGSCVNNLWTILFFPLGLVLIIIIKPVLLVLIIIIMTKSRHSVVGIKMISEKTAQNQQCGCHDSRKLWIHYAMYTTSFYLRSSSCRTDLSIHFQPSRPTTIWMFFFVTLTLFLVHSTMGQTTESVKWRSVVDTVVWDFLSWDTSFTRDSNSSL